MWGGQFWPQAGLPAGWTRWKAGPQAERLPHRHVVHTLWFVRMGNNRLPAARAVQGHLPASPEEGWSLGYGREAAGAADASRG